MVDSKNPDIFEIAGWGRHDVMEEKIVTRMIKYSVDVSNDIFRRLWRGSLHRIQEFQSKIVRLYIQIDDPSLGENLDDSQREIQKKKFLSLVQKVWQFFKENYPDWIMVDINGNPLEEVLRQE